MPKQNSPAAAEEAKLETVLFVSHSDFPQAERIRGIWASVSFPPGSDVTKRLVVFELCGPYPKFK